ncbi:MAG TPA: tetratricopeptide repeat protein [Bryobacteraceae bacterium]
MKRKVGTLVRAALCAFAIGLTALSAEAQSRHESQEAEAVSEQQLLAARSKQHAGEYNAARDLLLQALPNAPNSAALLDALGSVQQDLGEYLEAERSYLHALSASAQSEGDPERVAILHNLGTLYLDTGQHSKGERVREQLKKLRPQTLHDHPAETAALLNVIACLEHARNRDDEAERYYSESLRFFHQAHGPVSVDAALVKANLGFLRFEDRRYESAAGLFRQAIREIEVASGPENPALIRLLVNLARCENMSGHMNDAEPAARRAVRLSVKIFGEGHLVTATAMLEQATTLHQLGHKKMARDLEKRAKAWLRDNPTRNPAGYTVSVRDLAALSR